MLRVDRGKEKVTGRERKTLVARRRSLGVSQRRPQILFPLPLPASARGAPCSLRGRQMFEQTSRNIRVRAAPKARGRRERGCVSRVERNIHNRKSWTKKGSKGTITGGNGKNLDREDKKNIRRAERAVKMNSRNKRIKCKIRKKKKENGGKG